MFVIVPDPYTCMPAAQPLHMFVMVTWLPDTVTAPVVSTSMPFEAADNWLSVTVTDDATVAVIPVLNDD